MEKPFVLVKLYKSVVLPTVLYGVLWLWSESSFLYPDDNSYLMTVFYRRLYANYISGFSLVGLVRTAICMIYFALKRKYHFREFSLQTSEHTLECFRWRTNTWHIISKWRGTGIKYLYKSIDWLIDWLVFNANFIQISAKWITIKYRHQITVDIWV
jgi:hypothetical protein